MSSKSLSEMTNNVNVGIDEVVAIFVSQFETDLYNRKDKLSDKIRSLKAGLDKIVDDLKKSVNKAEFEAKVEQFGLSFKVDNIEVRFEVDAYARNKVGTAVSVGMYDKASDRSYAVYTKTITLPIAEHILEERQQLVSQLKDAEAELLAVMAEIKQVSRKERQVRGKIAELKLQEAGKSDLLSNPELVKLIAIDRK